MFKTKQAKYGVSGVSVCMTEKLYHARFVHVFVCETRPCLPHRVMCPVKNDRYDPSNWCLSVPCMVMIVWCPPLD